MKYESLYKVLYFEHTIYGSIRRWSADDWEQQRVTSRGLSWITMRGEEIESALADGPRSQIYKQVENGVAVRMAALFLLIVGQGGNKGLDIGLDA